MNERRSVARIESDCAAAGNVISAASARCAGRGGMGAARIIRGRPVKAGSLTSRRTQVHQDDQIGRAAIAFGLRIVDGQRHRRHRRRLSQSPITEVGHARERGEVIVRIRRVE